MYKQQRYISCNFVPAWRVYSSYFYILLKSHLLNLYITFISLRIELEAYNGYEIIIDDYMGRF